MLGDLAEQDGALDGHHGLPPAPHLSSSRITNIPTSGCRTALFPAPRIDLMLRRTIIIRCATSMS